jgi:hypothetical protein
MTVVQVSAWSPKTSFMSQKMKKIVWVRFVLLFSQCINPLHRVLHNIQICPLILILMVYILPWLCVYPCDVFLVHRIVCLIPLQCAMICSSVCCYNCSPFILQKDFLLGFAVAIKQLPNFKKIGIPLRYSQLKNCNFTS